MSSSTAPSIVQVLNEIVDKKINTTQQMSTPKVVLYQSGSTLVATNLNQLSF